MNNRGVVCFCVERGRMSFDWMSHVMEKCMFLRDITCSKVFVFHKCLALEFDGQICFKWNVSVFSSKTETSSWIQTDPVTVRVAAR